MHDAGGLLPRGAGLQVLVELLHPPHHVGPRKDLVNHQRGLAEVAAPGPQLPRGVVSHLAIVLQPDGTEVHGVEVSNCITERGPDSPPLLGSERSLCTADRREGTARDALHEVEGRAEHGFVAAVVLHLGHRHAAALQGSLDAELAVDLVRAHEEAARRLPPQHAAHGWLPGRPQEVRGVGRARAELRAPEVARASSRQREARQLPLQVGLQAGQVQAEAHLAEGRGDAPVRLLPRGPRRHARARAQAQGPRRSLP
mmetsp:Transcript_76208/g.236779  ORF Transcript_76208/g.236779 Transcript_76208/m.236779 type:complete len:256 (+) Transcript_76208:976-1743(+)